MLSKFLFYSVLSFHLYLPSASSSSPILFACSFLLSFIHPSLHLCPSFLPSFLLSPILQFPCLLLRPSFFPHSVFLSCSRIYIHPSFIFRQLFSLLSPSFLFSFLIHVKFVSHLTVAIISPFSFLTYVVCKPEKKTLRKLTDIAQYAVYIIGMRIHFEKASFTSALDGRCEGRLQGV